MKNTLPRCKRPGHDERPTLRAQGRSEVPHLQPTHEAAPEVKVIPSSSLLAAALDLAGRGYPVFPVYDPSPSGCSCGRRSCNSRGKHLRTEHGLSDATCDPMRIGTWRGRWPAANIGLAVPTGHVVLDCDDATATRGLRGERRWLGDEPSGPTPHPDPLLGVIAGLGATKRARCSPARNLAAVATGLQHLGDARQALRVSY